MKVIDDIKMSKVIDDMKLCVAKCDNGNLMLYVGNFKGKIFLKRFFSYRQYERFLTRSVIFSLMARGSSNKDVDRCYKNLQNSIEEIYSEKNSIL